VFTPDADLITCLTATVFFNVGRHGVLERVD